MCCLVKFYSPNSINKQQFSCCLNRTGLIPNFKSCRGLIFRARAGKLPDHGDVILPQRRAPPVRRIVPFLLTLPRRIDIVFQSSKLNKLTWSFLSILFG